MKLETYIRRTPGWCFAAGIWDGAGILIMEFNVWKFEFRIQLSR